MMFQGVEMKCDDCKRSLSVANNGSNHVISIVCPDCMDKRLDTTKPKKGTLFADPKDVMDCPRHHLPAIPDKDMIYQCKKCVEETREMSLGI